MLKTIIKIKSALKPILIEYSEAHYYKLLQRELENCKSVLDVGCGINSPLVKLKKSFYLEGIDLVPEKRINKIHDKFTRGNILAIEKYFKNKSFDAVVLLGVIEHLKRSDGKILLAKLEKIAKKKIIISTPNGFLTQDPSPDNPYQEHISGWTTSDFKKFGYNVYGLRGFKFLRGEYALVKYKPWYFWLFLSSMTQHITYHTPQVAFELLPVKILRSK